MTLAEQVGELLTEVRGDKPRRALARELDVAASTLVAVETGRANVTLARLERLAAGYGVALEVRAVATEVAEATEALARRRRSAAQGLDHETRSM